MSWLVGESALPDNPQRGPKPPNAAVPHAPTL